MGSERSIAISGSLAFAIASLVLHARTLADDPPPPTASQPVLSQAPVQQMLHQQRVSCISISPSGKSLATLTRDRKTCRVWDVSSGKMTFSVDSPRETGEDDLCMFSNDEKTLVIAGCGKSPTLVVDPTNGAVIRKIKIPAQFPAGMRYFGSPDGRFLVCDYSRPGIVDLVRGGEPKWLKSLHFEAITFSADGKTLYGVAPDGTLFSWTVPEGKETTLGRIIPLEPGPRPIATSLTFSPDGKTAFLAYTGIQPPTPGQKERRQTYAVATFSMETRKVINRFSDSIAVSSGPGIVAGVLPWAVASTDGTLIATMGDAGHVFYDSRTGKQISKNAQPAMGDGRFSPDGTFFLSSEMAAYKVFRVKTGEELMSFQGIGYETFSKDGKFLVTVGIDGTSVEIREVHSGP